MRSISFVIPGIPTAWARARTHGKIHFTPGKQRQAMSVVQTIASQAINYAAPIEVPVSMTVHATWPWPKSWSEKKKKTPGNQYKSSRPDADNIGKLVADSLNGITFVDDAQIVELRVVKQYGVSAETRVLIETLQEEGK